MDNPSPRPCWTHCKLAFIPFTPQHAHMIVTSDSHITKSHGQFPVAAVLATDSPTPSPNTLHLTSWNPLSLVSLLLWWPCMFLSSTCSTLNAEGPKGPSGTSPLLSSSSVYSLADLISYHGFIYNHIWQLPELQMHISEHLPAIILGCPKLSQTQHVLNQTLISI